MVPDAMSTDAEEETAGRLNEDSAQPAKDMLGRRYRLFALCLSFQRGLASTNHSGLCKEHFTAYVGGMVVNTPLASVLDDSLVSKRWHLLV